MNSVIKNSDSKGSQHNVFIEGRKRAQLSAIDDVISFDERSVVLGCALGVISIEGEELHILKMNVESGDIVIEGRICSMIYIDKTAKKSTLLRKK